MGLSQPSDHLFAHLAAQVPGLRRVSGAHEDPHLDHGLLGVRYLQGDDPLAPKGEASAISFSFRRIASIGAVWSR
jgi:hypothetical protein